MELTIRDAREGEEPAVSAFIRCVYDKYVAPGELDEGRETFARIVEPGALASRREGNRLCVADCDGRLVGALEVRGGTHVALLFVDEAWQREGVGRRLMLHAFGHVEDWPPITVNSSPSAVGAYARMGFVAVEHEQVQRGIRFTPMRRPPGAGRG